MYRNVEGYPQALRAHCSHLLPKYALGMRARAAECSPAQSSGFFFLFVREGPREDTARYRAVSPGGAIPAGFA